jgi:hypothetical protein
VRRRPVQWPGDPLKERVLGWTPRHRSSLKRGLSLRVKGGGTKRRTAQLRPCPSPPEGRRTSRWAPLLPNKPSWTLKPTAKDADSSSAPVASIEAAIKLTSPGNPLTCQDLWVSRQIAPLTPLSKWINAFPRGPRQQSPSVRVWGEKRADSLTGFARSPPAHLWPRWKAGSRCWCPRLPTASGPLSASCGPSVGATVWASYLYPPGGPMHLTVVEKLRKAHARGWDWSGAGGLALKCAGCNSTPLGAPGSGPRGLSADTTLRCVGGAWTSCGKNAVSHRPLRSENEGGEVQRAKRVAANQTLPALRTQPT